MVEKTKMHFLDLPEEILVAVFEYLDVDDGADDSSATEIKHTHIRELAYCSKRLHAIGLQFLLSEVLLSWPLLDLFNKELDTSLSAYTPYITKLSIHIPSSWGEWHRSETLQDVLQKCTNVETLSLSLSGSSKWLQYICPNYNVRTLHLISNQQNSSPALFDTCDLYAFRSVKVLKLEFFKLQCEYPIEQRAVPLVTTVEEMEILNCEWNYPFSMSLFKNLKILSVFYTIKCEPFTYSERLKHLASHPPSTLKKFAIHLNLHSSVRQKTWYPILSDCEELELVSLKGFRYPAYEFFARLPLSLREIELHMPLKNYMALTALNSLDTGMGSFLGMNFRNDLTSGKVVNKFGEANIRVIVQASNEPMQEQTDKLQNSNHYVAS
ncbi:uncharacterized protein V1518DRAFT_413798 [Limtongia smithiae]|uniref:uncharacterized protein n=1 Tax=Limtongia smithiae TaxID=1125753 RepID=UPI0034CDD499